MMRYEVLFATNNSGLASSLEKTSRGRQVDIRAICSMSGLNRIFKERNGAYRGFLLALSLDELNRIFDLDLDKKFKKVEYLKKENALACTFQNGKSYLLKRENFPEDSGAKVKRCAIDRDGYHFTIHFESGEKYDIPWDFVLHRCEPGYEFYRDKPVDALSPREIGDRIAKVRKSKGITQEKLSKSTGILRANIARIESGRHNPSLETLHKIAKGLKAPVAALLAK